MPKLDLSLIIPTYTGQEHIEQCFQSILDQKYKGKKPTFEIIVVIDGPNKSLRQIVDKNKAKLETQNIQCAVHQFSKNQGRFEARLKGAMLAKSGRLLFLDDRITFGPEYIQTIINLRKDILIPNVIESISKNYISRCLYLLRRFVYGKAKFGASFESYYITEENFESTPKGTTSLWISKLDFISACNNFLQENVNSKFTNEDTKIFKYLLQIDKKIYKSSEAVINYQPRAKALDEVEHVYHRGPRFVDYYSKPGTRFFPLIVGSIILGLGVILLLITMPKFLLICIIVSLMGLVLLSLLIKETYKDFPKLVVGLPIIFLTFTIGIYKGVLVKIADNR